MIKFRLYLLMRADYWVTFSFIAAIIVVGIVITLTISMLPLIPSWQATKLPVIGVVVIAIIMATGWHIIVTWRTDKFNRRRKLIVTIDVISAILGVAVIWLILIGTTSFLYGEEIVASIRDHGSGDEIFVYHLSGVPDGFISTRIAVRCGWLPVEQTIFQIREPFTGSRSIGSGLELMFGIGGNLRYAYFDGHLNPTAP